MKIKIKSHNIINDRRLDILNGLRDEAVKNPFGYPMLDFTKMRIRDVVVYTYDLIRLTKSGYIMTVVWENEPHLWVKITPKGLLALWLDQELSRTEEELISGK